MQFGVPCADISSIYGITISDLAAPGPLKSHEKSNRHTQMAGKVVRLINAGLR